MHNLVAKSHDAFLVWRKTPAAIRATVLDSIAAALRANADELAQVIAKEMGKPITEGKAEIEKCAATASYFARFAPTVLVDELRQSGLPRSFVRYEPLGPILAVMPWNFPFWQFFRMGAPALIAGNSIILKHSTLTRRCAKAIVDIFAQCAGVPKNLVLWADVDHDEVETMMKDDLLRAVTFTGSTRGGAEVAALAGRHLKKIVLELGGSDAFIVFADANIKEVARHAARARCQNGGQSCIAAKRFIVHESIINEFIKALVLEMTSLVVGDPLDGKTEIGPLASKDQQLLIHAQVADAQAKGATTWCGGALQNFGLNNFYPPTILSGITKSMRIYDEEVFGPVAQVSSFNERDEAIARANDTPFGLSASIWTTNIENALDLVSELECGSVFINAIPRSDPALPFGGIKQSGYGRELGREGLLEFVNIKSVAIS